MADDDPARLFSEWVNRHGNAVLKVARAYTRTIEDCQDLVQEILLQVWRSLPQFRGDASVPTWCYRVALNTALQWRRGERRRRPRSRSLFDVEALAVAEPDSSECASRRELVERLYHAIRELPVVDSALILLHLEGLTYGQMAEVLGMTESHVGVKLHRAKAELSQRLRDKHEH